MESHRAATKDVQENGKSGNRQERPDLFPLRTSPTSRMSGAALRLSAAEAGMPLLPAKFQRMAHNENARNKHPTAATGTALVTDAAHTHREQCRPRTRGELVDTGPRSSTRQKDAQKEDSRGELVDLGPCSSTRQKNPEERVHYEIASSSSASRKIEASSSQPKKLLRISPAVASTRNRSLHPPSSSSVQPKRQKVLLSRAASASELEALSRLAKGSSQVSTGSLNPDNLLP